jgi:UDP-glucuronate decarboxylase
LIDRIVSEDLEEIARDIDRDIFKGMKTLVTGGTGFLGSYLCDVLVKFEANVTCLDNFSTGVPANISHLTSDGHFKMTEADVSTFDTEETFDYIFHFASRASPEDYQIHPVETLITNSLGSFRVLESARKGRSRIILASTSEIYGDPRVIPTPEEYWGNVNPVGVRSCYDEGKRFSEALFAAYCREHELDARTARIHNTYGPRLRADGLYARAVSRFIKQALSNEDITIYGDGLQTRSFCYVTDTIRGILLLLASKSSKGKTLNIGSPEEITILGLAEKIIEMSDSRSSIKFFPKALDDPRRRCPDIRKALNELSWHPKIKLEEGLSRTIDWFRSESANVNKGTSTM